MSHALMYLYLNPSCAKAGEVGLQGLMYKLILIIITTTSANAQFSSSFYEGLACIAPTSCSCSFVAFTQ